MLARVAGASPVTQACQAPSLVSRDGLTTGGLGGRLGIVLLASEDPQGGKGSPENPTKRACTTRERRRTSRPSFR